MILSKERVGLIDVVVRLLQLRWRGGEKRGSVLIEERVASEFDKEASVISVASP